MLNRVRSDAEIMKRGRWKRLSSLKTYEQGGRLSQVFGKLSEAQQKSATDAVSKLSATMAHSIG